MDKKIIIGVIIVILAIIAVFSFASSNDQQIYTDGKLNTYIDFQSTFSASDNDTDATDFILKDRQGNVLAKENVTVTYKINGQDKSFNATTDDKGYVHFDLVDMDKGSVDVIVKFAGNDKYNSCQETQPHMGV